MKPQTLQAGIFLLIGASLLGHVEAVPSLPAIFSKGMVVQRESEVPVWGRASPGARIHLSLSTSKAETMADDQGRWSANLPPLRAGGPHELTVSDGDATLRIGDVLVGEVWVASGQSWMKWDLARADNAEEEIKAANYPDIRMFTVPETAALTPQDDCRGVWAAASPATVRSFSACGYFFARRLHETLGVPIGIVHASVSGTGMWAWTSREVFQEDAALQKRLEAFDAAVDAFGGIFYKQFEPAIRAWLDAKTSAPAGEKVPYPPEILVHQQPPEEWEKWLAEAEASAMAGRTVPMPPVVQPYPTGDPRNNSRLPSTVLFNGMIHPLIPYGIAGFLWYQGGSEGPEVYRSLFPAMIQDWRRKWGRGDLPFLFVQRPNVNEEVSGGGPRLPEFREAQSAALELPNTGMAVAIDIGLPGDLHPTNKQESGRRLALLAEKMAYGREVIAAGPTFDKATVEKDTIRLHFTSIGGGLMAADGGVLLGFEVAGASGQYVAADATIDDTTVLVSCREVPEPVAARYAWAANPTANLVNKDGLPAPPFRTEAR